MAVPQPPGSADRSRLPAPSMSAERAEALVVEYREVFAYFDRDFDGKLTTEEFADAVRALGHAPTETQLTALTKTVARVYPAGSWAYDVPGHSAARDASLWYLVNTRIHPFLQGLVLRTSSRFWGLSWNRKCRAPQRRRWA